MDLLAYQQAVKVPGDRDVYLCRVFIVTPTGVAIDTGDTVVSTAFEVARWLEKAPWPPLTTPPPPEATFPGPRVEFRVEVRPVFCPLSRI